MDYFRDVGHLDVGLVSRRELVLDLLAQHQLELIALLPLLVARIGLERLALPQSGRQKVLGHQLAWQLFSRVLF
jgi:hypothetical protein